LPRLERIEAEVFEEDGKEVIMAMIPAPLGFFEMKEEELRADSPELDEGCSTRFSDRNVMTKSETSGKAGGLR
jgi:hypothetical protein